MWSMTKLRRIHGVGCKFFFSCFFFSFLQNRLQAGMPLWLANKQIRSFLNNSCIDFNCFPQRANLFKTNCAASGIQLYLVISFLSWHLTAIQPILGINHLASAGMAWNGRGRILLQVSDLIPSHICLVILGMHCCFCFWSSKKLCAKSPPDLDY